MGSKKAEERVVASFLLKKVASEGLADLICSEEPDFLTRLGRRGLGIEVRSLRDDLISGSDAVAATEGTQDRTTALARKLYESRGLPPASVYILWSPTAPRRLDAQAVAKAVVDAVSPIVATPVSATGFAASAIDGRTLPAGIARVRIYRTTGARNAHWFSIRGGWGTTCPPAAIQKALDDKERKLPQYRKKARTVWLALSVLGTPSSKMLMPRMTLRAQYRSTFDRVFLVDLSSERVHELRRRTRGRRTRR